VVQTIRSRHFKSTISKNPRDWLVRGVVILHGIVDIFLGGKIARVCLSENREENRGENREESACGALLRALHAPGGADEERIARGCPASMCTAP